MYQEKFIDEDSKRQASRLNNKRRLRWSKNFVLFCSIALLLIGVVGGSLAYMLTQTNTIVNTFTPVNMNIEIDENFDGTTKENVTVKNTSDVPAYIRATYTAYWKNADGSVNGSKAEYDVIIGAEWQQDDTDDVYYYKGVVASGASTTNFIVKCVPTGDTPTGCTFVVEVIAEAIQAEPITAVEEAWKMTYSNGTWSSVQD